MRKALIVFNLCSICFLAVNCSSKNDENKAPSVVQLEFPTKDLLCIDHTIPFNWSDATDLENDVIEYNIIIAKDRELTDVVENRTVSASELTVILEKSTAYYWQVKAIDVDNNQESNSEVFSFYTKGDGVTNYAPFMADLQMPENNGNVAAGTVNLVWEASDIDAADTLTYELFFGEDATLTSIDNTLTVKSYIVSVLSGKTYSWQVNVTDNAGAKSIGQVFTFTVD
ncbi:hypothetical protein MPF19_16355 [Polaribacter sp. Z014]|uniref:hypothetical protein n=1 Tax=Polaribacter sp. Z014 TaxID=2927126 RepID=UPI002020317A|nr:hypothetical protein [Polaribacter sp. Z014]MCL7764996.1 hypothetical protein [Polaribacter sp. Z014]